MPYRPWISRAVVPVAGVLTALTLTACGGADPDLTGSAGATSTSSSTTAPATTTPRATGAPGAPGTLTITDTAAAQLCDMLRPELSNLRVQGPTLGKLGLNAMVHEWALRNGGINAQVLADKDVVDRVMTTSCPDVRTDALAALELPSLAAGLAF